MKAAEAAARRESYLPRIPGRRRREMPESQRMLYGNSREARDRVEAVFKRAAAADEYLASFKLRDCDYCEEGW